MVVLSGGNIDVTLLDRLWPGIPLGSSQVEIFLETRDKEHGAKVLKKLKEKNISILEHF